MPTTAPDRDPLTPLGSRERLPRTLVGRKEGAVSPLGLDRSVRRYLENLTGETFVSFAGVRDAVSIWAADDRGMHFFQADLSLSAIQELSGELLSLLGKPSSSARRIQRLSRQLYPVLFGPIAPFLEESRSIAVHFSEELRCIPVGLLEDETGKLLVERFSLWNAADFPWRVGKPIVEAIHSDARLLIVDSGSAHADGDASLEPPIAEGLRCAMDAFPNHDLVRGGAATHEQFHRLALHAQVLHCRAVLTEAVHCPCMLFAIDEANAVSLPLPGYNPRSLPHCALGVLDAEYGEGDSGEAPDLWRPVSKLLHSVGIANVVMPRWNVPLETRRAFHEVFYQDLRDGVPLREAIRNAHLHLRGVPTWRHPHHWAGFMLSVSHI